MKVTIVTLYREDAETFVGAIKGEVTEELAAVERLNAELREAAWLDRVSS